MCIDGGKADFGLHVGVAGRALEARPGASPRIAVRGSQDVPNNPIDGMRRLWDGAMMGKTCGGDYAGNPEKAGFVCIKQEDPYGCGAACLRMIELWATGKCHCEADWRRDAKMVKETGIGYEQMETALKGLKLELETRKVGDSVPDDLSNSDVVYLLATNSYGVDGEDYGHWIVMLDRLTKHKQLQLVVYADPLYAVMVVSPWQCLRETKVQQAYRIERQPRR